LGKGRAQKALEFWSWQCPRSKASPRPARPDRGLAAQIALLSSAMNCARRRTGEAADRIREAPPHPARRRLARAQDPAAVLRSVLENLGAPKAPCAWRWWGNAHRDATALPPGDNLLDQTRLESGTLKPKLDWCDAADLVNAAVDGVRDSLAGHPLEIDLPATCRCFGRTPS